MLNKPRLKAGWRTAPIATALLLLTLSGAGRCQAQAIEFRTYPLPGQLQRHTLEKRQTNIRTQKARDGATANEEEAAAKGNRNIMTRTESVSWRETSTEDTQGDYSLRLKHERIQTSTQDLGGKSQDILEPLFGLEIQARLNQARGDAAEIKVLNREADPNQMESAQAAIANALHALKEFEGKNMELGQPIEVPLPDLPELIPGAVGHSQAYLRSTLLSVDDGVATLKVEISMAYTFDVEGNPPRGPHRIRASGQGGGLLQWRIRDRLVVHNQQSMQLQHDFDWPDGSAMRMQAQMEMKSRGESIPAR